MNKYTRIKENYKHVIFIIIKGKSSNFHKYYSSPWHLHNPGENSPRWKKKKKKREKNGENLFARELFLSLTNLLPLPDPASPIHPLSPSLLSNLTIRRWFVFDSKRGDGWKNSWFNLFPFKNTSNPWTKIQSPPLMTRENYYYYNVVLKFEREYNSEISWQKVNSFSINLFDGITR